MPIEAHKDNQTIGIKDKQCILKAARKTIYYIHIMGIIQPMAEFSLKTMKVRLTNNEGTERKRESCQINLDSEKTCSKNKSKQRHFQIKEIKKFGHRQLCNCSF